MTGRIRWAEPGAGTGAETWTGYAGTVEVSLFSILPPSPGYPDWALTSRFPGAAHEARYADDGPGALEELKAEAERWLEEHVAALGASFANVGEARWQALKDWVGERIDADLAVAESFKDLDKMTSSMHFALVSANRSAYSKMTELETGQ